MQMADNMKEVGKGDRIRVSLQKHEVHYIAKKFGISGQGAAGAIRAAGPSREKVYAYIKAKKKAAR
jgi:voltage-gated potassium channel Kch